MTRSRRRGGPGDWIAPGVALAFVALAWWAGARALHTVGWTVPWGSVPQAVSDVPVQGIPRSAGRAPPRREPVLETPRGEMSRPDGAARAPGEASGTSVLPAGRPYTAGADIDVLRGRARPPCPCAACPGIRFSRISTNPVKGTYMKRWTSWRLAGRPCWRLRTARSPSCSRACVAV